MRLGHRPRQFKGRNCLLASDRWKALEKFVERISGFEVVVQRLDAHTGADKNRGAAEDLRVPVYDSQFRWTWLAASCCSASIAPQVAVSGFPQPPRPR